MRVNALVLRGGEFRLKHVCLSNSGKINPLQRLNLLYDAAESGRVGQKLCRK
eukprot:COSAG05_NODE_8618_length_687_cov_1.057823_1_plen_51_part_10